jgi:hypothetical protein
MLCPPRARGEALLTGSRPAGVCLHGRQLYLCSACGGGGLCSHGRRRATCVLCGPPLASALCARHPMERRDRCPCRRSPATADAGGGYGLPGIACPSFTAVEPTAQVRLRTPLLSLAGQEAFGRATADQRQDARLVTSVARYRSVLSAQARRPWSEEDARVVGCPSAVPSAAAAPRTRWAALTGRDGVRRGARKAVPCTDAASSRTRSAAEGHAPSRWCAVRPHRACSARHCHRDPATVTARCPCSRRHDREKRFGCCEGVRMGQNLGFADGCGELWRRRMSGRDSSVHILS